MLNIAERKAFVILRNEGSQRILHGDASFLSMTVSVGRLASIRGCPFTDVLN